MDVTVVNAVAQPPIDWAAWAGAIAGFCVAVVAVIPIISASRQRSARALLTAANLRVPLGIAHRQMVLACKDLQNYANSNLSVDRPELGVSVDRLRAVPGSVRGQLAKFNIADAAYLKGERGAQLAQAVGVAESALAMLDASIGKFDQVMAQYERTLSTSASTVQGSLIKAFYRVRCDVVKEAADLPDLFTAATDRLGNFVTYLERLFPPDS